MFLNPLKTTTALVASLSLMLPHPALVAGAWAQEVELLCLDASAPPCPEGQPSEGSTQAERAEFAAAESARLATEAEEAARLLEQEAAEADAVRLELEAADAAARVAAQVEADRAVAEAAEAEAQAEALRVAEEAAAAEAEARAAGQAAAAEAEALADEEEAAAETADALAFSDPTLAEEGEGILAATSQADAVPEDVVEESMDAQSVRTSEQDFATAIGSTATGTSGSRGRSGLSNLETALLLGLGAVAVGAVLRNGDRVVANTGDRVVVEGARGLTVYKDDDALLRSPGTTLRTETFSDGSSRSFFDRADGSCAGPRSTPMARNTNCSTISKPRQR